MHKKILNKEAEINKLAEILMKCPEVTKFNRDNTNEAGTLAHAFSDLEESFRVFLEEQLPQLTQKKLSNKEIYDLLLEIGEEFRHILYHIKDPEFYSYL